MKTLHVDLGDRSYPIYIGPNLLGNADLLTPHIGGKQVMIVSNETVAPLYIEKLRAGLADFQVQEVILPDGEQYKNLDVLNTIFDALLQAHFDRSCTVIALGGGVIGDMAGFAAASYQRSVAFIQVPTTLLAQVDSSVGGKTGVNHPLGKNMIGAFYQPQCVIADTAVLKTLDKRQLHAGIAEVIKYGLIRDAEFLAWIEARVPAILACDDAVMGEAIERSCINKADIVAEDELESGVRALLNLGHTFGHAIEAGMGYGVWLHGEAVATGMCMAAEMSRRMGLLNDDEVNRIDDLITAVALPIRAPREMDNERFLELMAVDKKAKEGKIRFVLLKGIGSAFVNDNYEPSVLLSTLDSCRSME